MRFQHTQNNNSQRAKTFTSLLQGRPERNTRTKERHNRKGSRVRDRMERDGFKRHGASTSTSETPRAGVQWLCDSAVCLPLLTQIMRSRFPLTQTLKIRMIRKQRRVGSVLPRLSRGRAGRFRRRTESSPQPSHCRSPLSHSTRSRPVMTKITIFRQTFEASHGTV